MKNFYNRQRKKIREPGQATVDCRRCPIKEEKRTFAEDTEGEEAWH
jgi:hypothetical protein